LKFVSVFKFTSVLSSDYKFTGVFYDGRIYYIIFMIMKLPPVKVQNPLYSRLLNLICQYFFHLLILNFIRNCERQNECCKIGSTGIKNIIPLQLQNSMLPLIRDNFDRYL